MTKIILWLVYAAVTAGVLWGAHWLFGNRLGRGGRMVMSLLVVLGMFVSLSAVTWAGPKRAVTVTALNQKSEGAEEAELTLSRLEINGERGDIPAPISGGWTRLGEDYRWFVPGDERRSPTQTDSVTFAFDSLDQVELVFAGNSWKGMAEITIDAQSMTLDTYRAQSEAVSFALPALSWGQTARAVLISGVVFALSLLALCALAILLLLGFRWLRAKAFGRLENWGPIQKMQGSQFLFEELVTRDFKKKYKRTVLGMAWSILSPLLTLLVMRLVFTQFFGRQTAHYTTYLFCGNLVFSYFNEATSQGMTSLRDNSAIFTKVNVPKYLFLLSKNVQTLINFGLTLCVFFVFCVLDNITFTWKFICLLYPIVCLVLFNIGVGLILSALYIFFRDIQYLWSVFTMLLMYMSAIFYTIDSYPPVIQNVFLINPVYLFIRYFRKIVIEATIPSLWFHLLMLADVLVVVGLGCWMYKKNNTKFLYYV